MTVIPALRSQGPALALTLQAKTELGPRAPMVTAASPVATPIRIAAPGQIDASTAIIPMRLAERDESNHPAAEAARKAYIKASIAAGVSPLPLP